MKVDKRADRRTNEQRDKHAKQSVSLFACHGLCKAARKKDNGCGRGRRKYAADIKPSNSRALHSHRQRPGGQESDCSAMARPTADLHPHHHETEMWQ
jgi:hypothetical protein